MEDKLNFLENKNKALCINTGCAKKDECLRHQLTKVQDVNITSFRILNPNHLAQFTADCPYFIDIEPEKYAKGFVRALNSMQISAIDTVKTALIMRYGRKNYYKYRKGEMLLPPEEQDYILDLIRSEDPHALLEFDEYVTIKFE